MLYNSVFFRRCCTFLLVALLAVNNVLAAEKKDLRIGIIEGFPMAFMDQDGKIKGFYVDLANELAKQRNWEVQFYLESSHNLLIKLNPHCS